MIWSKYTIRDWLKNHPEVEVPDKYKDLFLQPEEPTGRESFVQTGETISYENPIKIKGKVDWKATAANINDQLTDLAQDAADKLNRYGWRYEVTSGFFNLTNKKLKFYEEYLHKACALLEEGAKKLEAQTTLFLDNNLEEPTAKKQRTLLQRIKAIFE